MKKWNNPELKNLNIDRTNQEEYCPNAKAKCWCEYYCSSCKGCKYDKGCFWGGLFNVKKCTCVPWTEIGPSTPVPQS